MMIKPIACSSLCAAAVLAAERPNIMIILADDSGYSDPGCYGGEIHTPNIDRLASDGMRFRQFYNNGRCSPTRASILTGRESADVGFGAGTLGGWKRELHLPAYRARLSASVPTIAEVLKGAGYQTMMAGKWHLGGSLMKESPREQAVWRALHPGWELTPEEMDADFNALPPQRGFDRFFGMISGETDFFFVPGEEHSYLDGNRPAELDYSRIYSIDAAEPRKSAKPFIHQGETGNAFYDTDGVTDRVLEMIREADDKTPFFMYVAYRAPHLPLQAPKELVDKYRALYDGVEDVAGPRIDRLQKEGLFPSEAPVRRRNKAVDPEFLAVHAAMVEKVDENVGRIIQTLEAEGCSQDTLIFYLSDNGAASHCGLLNAPYAGAKGQLWEGGTKTHCIAHWPAKIQAGSISDTLGWVGDLLPTALGLAGGAYPSEFAGKEIPPPDGRSLLPALLGQEMPPPDYLFFNDQGQQGVIFNGRWKLLIEPGWYAQTSKEPGEAFELYDLLADPAEMIDLAGQKPELVQELKAACETWQQQSGIVDYGEVKALKDMRRR